MTHQSYPTTLRDALMKAYFAGWYARDLWPLDLAGERVDALLADLGAEGDAPAGRPIYSIARVVSPSQLQQLSEHGQLLDALEQVVTARGWQFHRERVHAELRLTYDASGDTPVPKD
jgi:hypothetical protein